MRCPPPALRPHRHRHSFPGAARGARIGCSQSRNTPSRFRPQKPLAHSKTALHTPTRTCGRQVLCQPAHRHCALHSIQLSRGARQLGGQRDLCGDRQRRKSCASWLHLRAAAVRGAAALAAPRWICNGQDTAAAGAQAAICVEAAADSRCAARKVAQSYPTTPGLTLSSTPVPVTICCGGASSSVRGASCFARPAPSSSSCCRSRRALPSGSSGCSAGAGAGAASACRSGRSVAGAGASAAAASLRLTGCTVAGAGAAASSSRCCSSFLRCSARASAAAFSRRRASASAAGAGAGAADDTSGCATSGTGAGAVGTASGGCRDCALAGPGAAAATCPSSGCSAGAGASAASR